MAIFPKKLPCFADSSKENLKLQKDSSLLQEDEIEWSVNVDDSGPEQVFKRLPYLVPLL